MGEVNRLREQLQWFDTKPLFGNRILVTRARAQASEFADLLETKGAEVIQFPTIEIHPITDAPQKLVAQGPRASAQNQLNITETIDMLEEYDWVIFTSVNAVEIYYERLREKGKDARVFRGSSICAIGPKTVDALNNIGIHPDFVPSHSSGRVVATEIENVQGKKILLPRAKIATADLPNTLRERGAHVDDVPLYDTVKVKSEHSDTIEKDLLDGRIDYVTFTSSSTVKNFLEMFPTHSAKDLLENVQVAVIGPTTEATAKEHGMRVDVIAKAASVESLVEAIIVVSYKNPLP